MDIILKFSKWYTRYQVYFRLRIYANAIIGTRLITRKGIYANLYRYPKYNFLRRFTAGYPTTLYNTISNNDDADKIRVWAYIQVAKGFQEKSQQ